MEREKLIQELMKLKDNPNIRTEVDFILDVVKHFIPKLHEAKRDSEV